MKLLNLLTAAFIAFCAISCKSLPDNPYTIVESFPVEKMSTGEPIADIDEHIGLFGIKDAAEYIVCTQWKQDYFFKIFDKDFRFCGEICMRGNGPDEFLAPIYFGQYEIEDGDTKIWILERPSARFMKINLSETLGSNKPIVETEYDLHKYQGLLPRNLFFINDDLLFGTNDDELCETFVLNPRNDKLSYNDHAMSFSITPYTHSLSQNMITLKPDKTMSAACFFALPQIDIYTSDGKRIKTVFYEKIVVPQKIDVTDIRDYYSQIYSTDEFIFALYRDLIEKDSYENYIHVFSWKGEPLASVKISTASDFFFDDNGKNIVTVDFDAETNAVCMYDLSFL